MSQGYSSEPQFAPPSFYEQPSAQPPRRQGGGWLLPMLLIGGGVLILGGTICFAGAWYVIANVDRWVIGLGREAVVAVIEETDLPEPEKQEASTKSNDLQELQDQIAAMQRRIDSMG